MRKYTTMNEQINVEKFKQFKKMLSSESNKYELSVNDNGQFIEGEFILPIYLDATIIRGISLKDIRLDSLIDRLLEPLTKKQAQDWILSIFENVIPEGPLKYKHMRVTPTIAKILKKAEIYGNRNSTEGGVKIIEAALRDGKFYEDTGNTIKISVTGSMSDGGHRTSAVINSGIATNLTLCQGVSVTGALGNDIGRKRDFETRYEMYKRSMVSGVRNSVKNEALVLRYEYYYRNYCEPFLLSTKRFIQPNVEDIWDIHNENRTLVEEAAEYGNKLDSEIGAKSIMGFLAYKLLKKYPTVGKNFLDLLYVGNVANEKHVILAMRKKLIKIKNQKVIAKIDENGRIISDENGKSYIRYDQYAKNRHIIPIFCKGFSYFKQSKLLKRYHLDSKNDEETPYLLIQKL